MLLINITTHGRNQGGPCKFTIDHDDGQGNIKRVRDGEFLEELTLMFLAGYIDALDYEGSIPYKIYKDGNNFQMMGK